MGSRLLQKLGIAALCLALAFALSACGGDDEEAASGSGVAASSSLSGGEGASGQEQPASGAEASAAQSGGESVAEQGDASAASGDGSAASGDVSGASGEAAAAPPAPAAEVKLGRFIQHNEARYPEERAPILELLDGERAEMQVNSGLGELYLAEGSYTVSGSNVVFTIEKMEVEEDFLGYGQETLTFTVLDENNLKYAGGNYGLLLEGDMLTLEGAAPWQAPVASEAPPADASAAEEGVASGDASGAASAATTSGEPAASGAGSDASAPQDDTPVVAPGQVPPVKMEPGDSFELTGVDVASIQHDSEYLRVLPNPEEGSAVVTAVAQGETTLGYTLLDVPAENAEDFVGQQQYPITIGSGGGIGLPVIIIIGVVSLLLGAVIAFVLLRVLGGRGRKGKEGGEDAAVAEEGGEDATAGLDKRAAKKAKQTEKKLKKLEKKAEKARKAAEQAAQKASKAEKQVTQTASSLQQAIDDAGAGEEPADDATEEELLQPDPDDGDDTVVL